MTKRESRRASARVRGWWLVACAATSGMAMAAACSSDGTNASGAETPDGSLGGPDSAAPDDASALGDTSVPSDAPAVGDAIADGAPVGDAGTDGARDGDAGDGAPFITASGFVWTPSVPGTRCPYALTDGSAGEITCSTPSECCEAIAAPATCIGADASTTSCAIVSTCDGPEDCNAGEACAIVSNSPIRVACVASGAAVDVLCHTRADCPIGQSCCVPRPLLGDGGYGIPTSTVAYVSGGCTVTPTAMHACE